MKNTFFALLGLLMCGLLPAQATNEQAAAAAALPEAELMSIERDAHSRLLLITALVADTPMRMILDTGATHTILHKDSTKKIKKGAMWLNTSHIKFEGNTQERPEMMVANLQAGPGLAPRHPIVVLNLASVRSMMGEDVDGIIGMDILGSLPFTFDLKNGNYYWGTPEGAKLCPVRGKMERGGRMMVQGNCGGKALTMLLDTGSAITRVNAPDWAPGAGNEVMARLGNVNNTTHRKVVEGKPGDIDVAEGVSLKNVEPLLDEPGQSVLLGLDALKDSVLIHLPTQHSMYGQFFLAQP
ncbi:MAG: hypothetical protein E7033_08035 [Akkermansiaceae bacterium]|nr:hypothetical protein [Akkermansiaceae bacterium]